MSARRMLAGPLAAIVAAGVIAGGAMAQDGAAEGKTFAYIPHLTGHPVWLIAKDGWDANAAENGFEGQWVGSTTGDVTELVTALDAAIVQGVDGIAIAADQPVGDGAVDRSRGRGRDPGRHDPRGCRSIRSARPSSARTPSRPGSGRPRGSSRRPAARVRSASSWDRSTSRTSARSSTRSPQELAAKAPGHEDRRGPSRTTATCRPRSRRSARS